MRHLLLQWLLVLARRRKVDGTCLDPMISADDRGITNDGGISAKIPSQQVSRENSLASF